MDRLNGGGELFLTHTRMQDRMTLRMCIGQTQTEKRHVERAWRRIREAAVGLERNQAQG
jgi:aromatic-L-amino-acid decarboxylase